MNGQTKFSEKDAIIQNFIDLVKPYETQEPLHFDIRAYTKYLKDNNVKGEDLPKNILDSFRTK